MEQIGAIRLSDKTEILFFLDFYRGKKFANIRKFIRSDKYAGPTKNGIKLNKDVFKKVWDAMSRIPSSLLDVEEKEIVLIPLSEKVSIKVSISYYQGKYGIDIREYLKTSTYEGPSKVGVRIPYEHLNQVQRFLDQMSAGLGISIEKNHLIQIQEVGEEIINNPEGVPDEYGQYF